MHKKLIDHFKFTVVALGDKGLPPEFDCSEFPDENSEAYFQAVTKSYKGEIIQPNSGDSHNNSDEGLMK